MGGLPIICGGGGGRIPIGGGGGRMPGGGGPLGPIMRPGGGGGNGRPPLIPIGGPPGVVDGSRVVSVNAYHHDQAEKAVGGALLNKYS